MDDLYGQNLYKLFKESVTDILNSNFITLSNSVEVQGLADKSAKDLRLKWLDLVSKTIDSNFEQFKQKLHERILSTMTTHNPYLSFDGGRISVLPEGTKFWFRGTEGLVAVIEQKPKVRTMQFQPLAGHRNGWAKTEYNLSLPYVIFILTFNLTENDNWNIREWSAAFTNRPLRSPDDMLHHCPFPDTSEFQLCMGQEWTKPKASKNIAIQVERILEYFWGSQFRPEWMDNYNRIIGPGKRFANLEAWEAESQKDSMIALTVDWTPGHTLLEHIALLATKHPVVMKNTIPNKIVNNAIAQAWEEIQGVRLDELKELEATFIGHLGNSVSVLTKKIVGEGVATLDKSIKENRKNIKEDLAAQGYKQNDYLPLIVDEITPPPRLTKAKLVIGLAGYVIAIILGVILYNEVIKEIWSADDTSHTNSTAR